MPEQGFTLIARPLGVSARERVYDEIKKYPYEDAVLVLPNLLMLREARREVNCQVMSLDRLAMKLLNSNGYAELELISRRGKEIILEEVIAGLAAAGELKYFGKIADKPGFLKSMANLTEQLARSGADTEAVTFALEAWSDEKPQMRGKNADVLKIFRGYLAYLAGHKLFDLEGMYRLAVKALAGEERPPFMPFGHVYICDFYNPNPLELDFIESLSRRCRVVMGISFEEGREQLFEGARSAYERLSWLHAKSGGGREADEELPLDWGGGRELLLRGQGESPVKSSRGWLGAVHAASREEEMRCVLGRVKKELAAGAGCAELLIVARDLKPFAGLRRLADEYGVPVSLPATAPLSSRPLAELILLALKAVPDTKEGAKAYLELLGSGLTRLLGGLDWEELADISGKHYITRRSAAQALVAKSLKGEGGSFAKEALTPLAPFDSFIAGVGGRESVRGLRARIEELLAALELDRRLGSLCQEGKLAPEAVASCLSGRAELLDALKELERDYAACSSAESKLPLEKLTAILEDVCRNTQVMMCPGRSDGVTVTEAVNVRGMSFKSVYILGMRRGEFPRKFSENWVYNDSERRDLEMLGICLPRAAASGDEFFFLSAALCAREKLTLSWHVQEGEKPEEELSPYAEDLINLFGVEAEDAASGASFCSCEELEAEGLYAGPTLADAEVRENLAAAACADRLRKSAGEGSGVYLGDLKGTYAAKAYRERLKEGDKGEGVAAIFSASALDCYLNCPFMYLGQMVWREEAFREKEDKVEPQEEGNLLHDTLSYFASGVRELGNGSKEKMPGRRSYIGVNLCDCDPEALEEELMEAFSEVAESYLKAGKLAKGLSWQSTESRLRRWLKRWLKYELKQAADAPHSFAATELKFENILFELEGDSRVLLRGRIDRVDRYAGENQGDDCLYVVDYKRRDAPTKKEVEGGLALQLPLYCFVAPSALGGGLRVDKGYYLTLDKCASRPCVDFTVRAGAELREKFEPELREHIRITAEGILAGDFSLGARKKKCRKYCQLRKICRLRMLDAEGGEEDE